MRSIDVPAGTVFGRLTVIGETRTGARNVRAMICLCECEAAARAYDAAAREVFGEFACLNFPD